MSKFYEWLIAMERIHCTIKRLDDGSYLATNETGGWYYVED